MTIYDTVRLIAQAREYADHRDDPKRGQPPRQSELLRTLAAALEAADAEVEKAHAAMTHWLGKANDAEADLAAARAALTRLANPTHVPRTEEAALVQIEVEEIARAALAAGGQPTPTGEEDVEVAPPLDGATAPSTGSSSAVSAGIPPPMCSLCFVPSARALRLVNPCIRRDEVDCLWRAWAGDPPVAAAGGAPDEATGSAGGA